jgi:hypothetical protein
VARPVDNLESALKTRLQTSLKIIPSKSAKSAKIGHIHQSKFKIKKIVSQWWMDSIETWHRYGGYGVGLGIRAKAKDAIQE